MISKKAGSKIQMKQMSGSKDLDGTMNTKEGMSMKQ
jgi:hypothetical protein